MKTATLVLREDEIRRLYRAIKTREGDSTLTQMLARAMRDVRPPKPSDLWTICETCQHLRMRLPTAPMVEVAS